MRNLKNQKEIKCARELKESGVALLERYPSFFGMMSK